MSVSRGLHPPTNGGGKVYPVVWPAVGAPLNLTMLDVAWLWLPVHWHHDAISRKRTSVLCRNFAEWCRCEGETALSWRGYCPAWHHAGRYLCVLNIDPATAKTFARVIGTTGRLYLTRFRLTRNGETNYGPVGVEVSPAAGYKWEGARPDIAPSLVRYYGDEVGAVIDRVQAEGGEPC